MTVKAIRFWQPVVINNDLKETLTTKPSRFAAWADKYLSFSKTELHIALDGTRVSQKVQGYGWKTALKVLSFATLLFPLIALIAKGVYKSYCHKNLPNEKIAPSPSNNESLQPTIHTLIEENEKLKNINKDLGVNLGNSDQKNSELQEKIQELMRTVQEQQNEIERLKNSAPSNPASPAPSPVVSPISPPSPSPSPSPAVPSPVPPPPAGGPPPPPPPPPPAKKSPATPAKSKTAPQTPKTPTSIFNAQDVLNVKLKPSPSKPDVATSSSTPKKTGFDPSQAMAQLGNLKKTGGTPMKDQPVASSSTTADPQSRLKKTNSKHSIQNPK